MKWLDKYSEDVPKAQAGKDISPTRADSLAIYNQSRKVQEYYKNYRKDSEISTEGWDGIHRDNDRTLKTFLTDGSVKVAGTNNKTISVSPLKKHLRQEVDENKYYQRESVNALLDTRAPAQLFDRRIMPTHMTDYTNTNQKDPFYMDMVGIYTYDPIAIKPFDLLTEKEKAQRVKKYGNDGVPKSYLNKISKNPLSTPPKKQPHPITQPLLPQKPTSRKKQTPISTIPLDVQPINSNLEIKTSELSPMARVPKKYKVETSGGGKFGGWSRSETVIDPDNISVNDGNKRTITPIYQDGGNVDPVAMRGMMKSKIGMGNALGHPAIKRMSQAQPKTGMTPEGIGTHFMSSVDNYAVPLLQDLGEEQLTLIDPDSRSKEAIRFNSPEEAQYFAENYKDVAPMSTIFKDVPKAQSGNSIKKKPIVVPDKNDPRYKAYQDSLSLYKTSLKNMWAEKNISKSKVTKKGFIPFNEFYTFIPGSNLEINDKNYYPGDAKIVNGKIEKINGNKVSTTKKQNLIKNNIEPIGFDVNEWTSKGSNKSTMNYSTIYKKPQEEVIVRKTPLVNPIKIEDEQYTPINSIREVKPVVKTPKKYKIVDTDGEGAWLGGGSTTQTVEGLENVGVNTRSKRTITPIYQYGGNKPMSTWETQQAKVKAEKDIQLQKLLKDKSYIKNLEKESANRRSQVPSEQYITINDVTNVPLQNKPEKTSVAARNKTNKEIAQERQARIDAQTQANAQPFDWSNFRQSLSDRSQATGDALRVYNEPNFFDDYLNAASMIGSMADNLGQAPLRAQQEDSYMPYLTAIGMPLTIGAVAGIGANSTGQFVNNLTNPLAGTGDLVNNLGNKYLPNAYKLNPLAKKAESFNNPNSFYRQVDDETFREGIESGLIRGKQNVDKTRGESIINLNKSFGDDAYYKKGSLYSPQRADYIYEVNKGEEFFIPKVNNRTRGYTTENTPIRVSKTPIPLEEASIYQKDWLKGYKQVDTPITSPINNIDTGLTQIPQIPIINTTKNLEDLIYAKEWGKEYGYNLPENLQRIAESDELTNRTIRGMMNRHNTFVRGVSTNWEHIEKTNPQILRHLEGKGIDWKNNPKAAAEYMATHVPIQTGYGRADLNNEVFNQGLDGIYTSNSIPTAEGYTYGQGYITKVKKPTDFSSTNRQDWITKNNPAYYDNFLPSAKEFSPKDLEKVTSKDLDDALVQGRISYEEQLKIKKYFEEVRDYKQQLKKDYRIDDNYVDDGNDKNFDLYLDALNFSKERIAQRVFKEDYANKLLRTERAPTSNSIFHTNKIIDKFLSKKGKNVWTSIEGSPEGEQLYQNIINIQKNNPENNDAVLEYLKQNYPDFDPIDRYSHYIHLGTPGTKLLDPVKSWEITPETWKNTSRAHTNSYSKKLSALSVAPIAPIAGATYMASQQNSSFKNGGVIKDDMGYWNPDNVGKTVEIGSGNITMEGVNQPLLGISKQTGEQKIMFPEKNYKFANTKQVVEYPMVGKGWLDKFN